MFDVNPIGPMRHLEQLERQATPEFRQLRSKRERISSVGLGSAVAAYLLNLAFHLRDPIVPAVWAKR